MENRLNYLLDKFQKGTLTEDELQEFVALVDNQPNLVTDEITQQIVAEEQLSTSKTVIDPKWNTTLDKILSVDKHRPVKKIVSFQMFKWLSAAVIFLVASVSLYTYLDKGAEQASIADVLPGSNKAVLTLANGKKIALSDKASGKLAEEFGISITKTANGEIVYNIAEAKQGNVKGQNTISTPKGGEWQIKLPDGSLVWLNAASALTYDLNIATAKQRHVKLEGEAYFEVAKNKEHPFVVSTLTQTVEVLGTHFNINSYSDEKVTKTTLLEGSIRVSGSGSSKILVPGEQSVVSSSGIKVSTVDTDESMAWKNGYFMFKNEKQESIMRKLSRWYNLEVEYVDEEAKDVIYYGTVSRFDKVSKILRKLEQTGEVHFDVIESKILVYKNKK